MYIHVIHILPYMTITDWNKSLDDKILHCFICCLFFCLFYSWTWGIWKFPGQELNWSCSGQATPQPQQLQILAAYMNYTTAHGNARSLIQWAKPGFEPTSSWVLVRFVTAEPQGELLHCLTWFKHFDKSENILK